jgi:hypothetical protein
VVRVPRSCQPLRKIVDRRRLLDERPRLDQHFSAANVRRLAEDDVPFSLTFRELKEADAVSLVKRRRSSETLTRFPAADRLSQDRDVTLIELLVGVELIPPLNDKQIRVENLRSEPLTASLDDEPAAGASRIPLENQKGYLLLLGLAESDQRPVRKREIALRLEELREAGDRFKSG